MRCEVCGAPFTPRGTEAICQRCDSSEVLSGRSQNPGPPAGTPSSPPERQPSIAPRKASSPPPVDPAQKVHKATVATGFTRSQAPPDPARDLASRATGPMEAVVESRTSLPLPEDTNVNAQPGPKSDVPIPNMPSSVVLEGKYRLLDELGRGSMGTVFLAEDTLLKRKVAVKFLLPELAHSTECAIRFKREAIAMASIRNENVAQIYSYGEDNGTPYFVMEHLEGETVEHLIDSYNRRGFFVPVADAVDIMIQVLAGVAAIHRADAVHRDIKPGNIMLETENNRAVMMDFGLVRDVKVEDDMRTLAGTPAYIAPELVEGKDGAATSQQADIYSLGATFYELLTGSIPFNGENWVEILQKHIAEMPEFPSTRRPGLPESLDDIVLRAMNKEVAERYTDCEEFLDDLLSVADIPDDATLRRTSKSPPGIAKRRASSGGYRRTPSASGSNSGASGGFRNTPSFSRGRLLVADSDRQFRSQIYDTAKNAVPSCRVHSATDGVMAQDMIKSVKPHVLVMNLSLQELSGFEIIASMVGDSEFDDMTVIAITENSGTKDAALLRGMGIKHFWSKPIDTEALLEVIMPALEAPMSMTSAPPAKAY